MTKANNWVTLIRKPKTRENVSPDELKSGNQIQGDWNSLNSRETLVRKFLNKEYYLQSFPGYKFLDQSTLFGWLYEYEEVNRDMYIAEADF